MIIYSYDSFNRKYYISQFIGRDGIGYGEISKINQQSTLLFKSISVNSSIIYDHWLTVFSFRKKGKRCDLYLATKSGICNYPQ